MSRRALALAVAGIGILALVLAVLVPGKPPPSSDVPESRAVRVVQERIEYPVPAPSVAEGPEAGAAAEPEPETETPSDPHAAWKLCVAVRTPAGDPVREAAVIFFAEASRCWVEAETDERGEATLDVKGTGVLVVAAEPPAGPGVAKDLAPPASGAREVEVTLSEGLVIEGVVRNRDGAVPAGPVEILAVPRDLPPQIEALHRRVEMGTAGRFRVAGLVPGRHALVVLPSNREDGVRPEEVPLVDAGTRDVRLDLAPHAAVEVRIVREGGWVEEDEQTAITVLDATGRRRAGSRYTPESPEREVSTFHLRPGLWRIEIVSDGYVPQEPIEIEVAPTDRRREVIVSLRRGEGPTGRLRLQVVVRGSAEPPRRVAIERGSRPLTFTTRTEELVNGSVTLELPAGRHCLTIARPPDARPFAASWLGTELEVEITAGGAVAREVVLQAAGWVRILRPETAPRGIALGFDEKDLRGYATLRAPDGRGFVPARGGQAMPFAPGRYVVEDRRRDGRVVRKTVTIRAGETTEVDFRD
jgi:hypothetical protein